MSFILQERLASIIEACRGKLPPLEVAGIILERLREEAEYDEIVRDALAATIDFHRAAKAKWPHIRRGEIETLNLLLEREYVPNEALLMLTRTRAADTIVKVWISRLRKLTQATISNHYGVGYSMKLEDRQRIKGELS